MAMKKPLQITFLPIAANEGPNAKKTSRNEFIDLIFQWNKLFPGILTENCAPLQILAFSSNHYSGDSKKTKISYLRNCVQKNICPLTRLVVSGNSFEKIKNPRTNR